MPTSAWYFLCAAAVLAQILALGALPSALAEPGATLWHLLAYAGLTLLLWIATDGRRPLAVAGGATLLALFTFPAGALAAASTGAILYWKTGARKPCVESSAR